MQNAELKTGATSTTATTTTTTYLVDGREYATLEEIPQSARRLIESTMPGDDTGVPGSSYVVDGRAYASLDEMPESDRSRLELAQRMIGEAGSVIPGGGFRPSPELVASVAALRGEPGAFGTAPVSPAASSRSPGESPRPRGRIGLIVVIVVLLAVIAFLLLR